MIDVTAPRFGLPMSLWVPIAAASVTDIESYVGAVLQRLDAPGGGRTNALLVRSFPCAMPNEAHVPLWQSSIAAGAAERLHPDRQVWVHVDYNGYRQAYIDFGMPPIPANYFLDHVQNRKAMRLRGNSHPYVRLSPVHRAVNTSAGHPFGGEGMERRFLAAGNVPVSTPNKIIYAEPMDLTKMLDVVPGTQVLNGVRDTQRLFYP
jgi:hypothetical protein